MHFVKSTFSGEKIRCFLNVSHEVEFWGQENYILDLIKSESSGKKMRRQDHTFC